MLTHHAYYIEGSVGEFEEYKKLIPHFVAQKYDRFGIDEARALTELASLKNIAGEAVFLLGLNSITSEAQQALLKLFEEPQKGTVFVMLAPHGALLATLKSRMLAYPTDLSTVTENGSLYFAKGFLGMGSKERSDLIAKMLKDEEGAKERVRDFVNALEVALSKDIKKNKDALGDIAIIRDYLGDRAPSMKMLLEHLALSLPNIQDGPR